MPTQWVSNTFLRWRKFSTADSPKRPGRADPHAEVRRRTLFILVQIVLAHEVGQHINDAFVHRLQFGLAHVQTKDSRAVDNMAELQGNPT